jgi:hypothetical protein
MVPPPGASLLFRQNQWVLSSERAALVRAFREGPELVRTTLRGVEDALDERPEPDAWTIREIVHHLADAELMAASRLRRLVGEDHPEIRGFDETQYTHRLHYERPIEAPLELLEASRQLGADLLETLNDAEWAREGTHEQFGPYSVEELVRRAVRHCEEHADQIRSTRLAVKPDAPKGIDWEREGVPGRREHQLHVQLAHITPPIWRRLVVPDTTPLPILHRILQTAFGWQDRHLHQFRVAQVRFAEPDDDLSLPAIDERDVRLLQVLTHPGDRCTYEYDFGDGWEHEILLEDIWGVEGRLPPRCTAGERAGPPEDCGGPLGYEHLIAALADPADEEGRQLRRWVGRFSPELCDVDAVNRRLARLPRGRHPIPAH